MFYTLLLYPTEISTRPCTVSRFHGHFPREAGTCGNPTFTRCNKTNFPSNFCCPRGSTCIGLESSGTLLCCPEGKDCSTILPISCDTKRQDPNLEPDSLIKTTRLNEDLPKCGKLCCPHGYRCEGDGKCVRDDESNETTTSPPVASSTTPSTAPPSSSATLLPNHNQTAAAPIPSCPKFPVVAVAAGFFPGILMGSILALAALMCYKRRKDTQPRPASEQSKFTHFRKRSIDGVEVAISDPIPSDAQDPARTDFLLHNNSLRPENDHDSGSRFYRTSARIRSFFGGKPEPASRAPPKLSITPPDQSCSRPMSSESVKRFTPAHLANGRTGLTPNFSVRSSRRQTTFTEMMERVGFENSRGNPHYSIIRTPAQHSGSSLRYNS